jgi:hypothetical protein
MRDWISSLTTERLPEYAVALAAGYALATLADDVAHLAMSILAQHAGSRPGGGGDPSIVGITDLFNAPYYLNVQVGDTIVVYGGLLSALVALWLVVLVGYVVTRRRNRALGTCPFCGSLVPRTSRHCAYCGSGIAPAES